MVLIDPMEFDRTVSLLRNFFKTKGFIEIHTQNRLSILAACEDPSTIATFDYAGQVWPLPQTGQMWLEHELLTKPNVPGYFCVSTSYRQEANPIEGRHDLIFPMFEFEMHGGIKKLIELEEELCRFLMLGIKDRNNNKYFQYTNHKYDFFANKYGVESLEAEHEEKMYNEYGEVVFITDFPESTSPFFNMRRSSEGTANKVDVIIKGIETIGSAERSIDVEQMRRDFMTISNGKYAETLFARFGKERVMNELDEFLKLPMFQRCGGGIGLTRMIRALRPMTSQTN